MMFKYLHSVLMEFNVVQISAVAFLGGTYSGGSIFDDFVAQVCLNLIAGVRYVDFSRYNIRQKRGKNI